MIINKPYFCDKKERERFLKLKENGFFQFKDHIKVINKANSVFAIYKDKIIRTK